MKMKSAVNPVHGTETFAENINPDNVAKLVSVSFRHHFESAIAV